MKHPANYTKRILVAVSGLSPAILTETLYALATQKESPFIPTEIHIITTIEGKERAENTLLKGNTPQFHALCEDYGLDNIQFNAEQIHVIEDKYGKPQNDIRTPEDNESAADFITKKLFELTREEDSALHVSIAGGRKTMGYYVGYALSLFGRQQDRLSHVLVDAKYERCRKFFYPTKQEITEDNEEGKSVDLSQANVYLAEIPFVRIAPYMSDSDQLKSGNISFSEAVKLAQSSGDSQKNIIINADTNEITLGQHTKKWVGNDSELSFYIWFIENCFENGGEFESPAPIKDDNEKYTRDYNKAYAENFINTYIAVAPHSYHLTRTKNALEKGMNYRFFTEKKTRVKSSLKEMFGPELAEKFEIKQVSLPSPIKTYTSDKKHTKKSQKPKKKSGYFTIDFKNEDFTIKYRNNRRPPILKKA
jgi:CRISPR-associated protein (TIGR02584 family)